MEVSPFGLWNPPDGPTAPELGGELVDAVADITRSVGDDAARVGGAVARAVSGEHRAADDPTLRVRGGIGGLAVQLDDLEAAARALLRCASAIEAVETAIAPGCAAPALLLAAPLDPGGAAAVQAALLRVLGPSGALAAAADVAVLAAHLGTVVLAYRGVEAATADAWESLRALVSGGVVGDVWRRGHLPWDTSVRAGIPRPRADVPLPSSAPDAAAGLLAAALGGADATPADVAAGVASNPTVAGLVGGTATVVTSAPRPPGPVPPGHPASGVGELLRRVDAQYPSGSARAGVPAGPRPGQVRVERIRRPGRTPTAVVYVPGTESWSLGGPVPMDAGTDLLALAGRRTAAGDAVTKALVLAGVGRDEPLLLVGHSQGGMVAAALAGDPAFRARFSPRAVVTAGSPGAGSAAPDDVAGLGVEHCGDLTPGADGAPAPDTPNWTTVEASTPDGKGTHDLSGYAMTGDRIDATDDPSVAAARAALAPFLDGDGATSESTEWVARRAG